MRRLVLSAAMLALAACTAPPAPNDPFAPVVTTLNSVFLWLPPPPPPLLSPPPGPGRLTLSNFVYDWARVESFVTSYPDCQLRAGVTVTNFDLPLNGTRVIDTPAGSDVCWRRIEPPLAEARAPSSLPPPIPWNRAYTSVGRIIDSRL
jgi:hypothetical protein